MDWLSQLSSKEFKNIKLYHEDDSAAVYTQKREESDSKVYIIRPPLSYETSRLDDTIRFKQDANRIKEISHPNLIEIEGVGELDEIPYYIQEPIPGKSLKEYMENRGTIPFSLCTHILIQIVQALAEVHERALFHKAINPQWIFLTATKKEDDPFHVKIGGFALHHTKEYYFESDGTPDLLYYMAPEQLGIINRNIDERCDLYAIGVLFFKMLFNSYPYQGANINQFTHSQLTKEPAYLKKKGIPNVGYLILNKLLAPEPEGRYQSTLGLLEDLKLLNQGKKDFTPGDQDQITRIHLKTELVGRQEELKMLNDSYFEAMRGSGKAVLISGDAGRGKTRLIDEFRTLNLHRKTIFLQGKCFASSNRMPYSIFNDVIEQYLAYFYKYSLERQNEIRRFIQQQLGGMESLLLKFHPGLHLIIDEEKEIPEIASDMENQRFLTICARFLCYLAQIEQGMILFLDDLHWADDGSIYLIEETIRHLYEYPLFLLGTYRDDEYNGAPVHTLAYHALRGHRVQHIKLKLLDMDKTQWLISKVLNSTLEKTKDISQTLYQKSKGNPFLLLEILKEYLSGKVLVSKRHQWELNRKKLDQMEPSPSIVDIIVKNLEYIHSQEKEMLIQAAVIGKKFSRQVLSSIVDFQTEDIIKGIDHAIELQILEKDSQNAEMLRFVHDRIQEALYSQLSLEKRALCHYQIGCIFEKEYIENPRGKDQLLFDMAYQFIESGKYEKIIEYAYPAAERALEQFAQLDALDLYHETVKSLEVLKQKGSPLWIECKKMIGKISIWSGKSSDAISHLKDIEPLLNNPYELAKNKKEISQAYQNRCMWSEAAQEAQDALKTLGVPLPNKGGWSFIRLWQIIFRFSFYLIPLIKGFYRKNRKKDKMIIQIYYIINTCYTMLGDSRMVTTVLQMINRGETRLKDVKELALSYQIYAVFLAEIPLFPISQRYHQKSISLRQKLKDPWGVVTSLLNMAFYYRGSGQYKNGISCFKENVQYLKKVGFQNGLGPGLSGLAGSYIYISDYRKAEEVNKEYLKFAEDSNSDFSRILGWMHHMLIRLEQGNLEEAHTYGLKAYHLARKEKGAYVICMASTSWGRCLIENKSYKEAITYLEKAQRLFEENETFLKEYTTPLFSFLLEAYLMDYQKEFPYLSKKGRKIYLKKIKQIKKTALMYTKKWISHRAYTQRICGQYFALRGRFLKAKRAIHRGIKLSKSLGQRYEEGRSYYALGKLYKDMGDFPSSRNAMKEAYSLFNQIGAKGFEKKTGEALGISVQQNTSYERFTQGLKHFQKVKSLIELSKKVSSILDRMELINYTMEKAMEISHAQGGWLVLQEEGSHQYYPFGDPKEPTPNPSDQELIQRVQQEGICLSLQGHQNQEEIRSILILPVLRKNQIIGVCFLENSRLGNLFTQEDQELLEILLGQLAISLENARLYKLAVTDGLTNLYNHRQFDLLLNKELDRSKRYHHSFALLMIDVDHFKKINDQYGHPMGDKVLKEIAQAIETICRSSDLVARFGGEEFAVILPEISQTNALIVAEKIRCFIEDNPFICQSDISINPTVSLGIALFPDHGMNSEAILLAADRALYQAKEEGRNRSVVFKKEST